jgi:hypothetical protein
MKLVLSMLALLAAVAAVSAAASTGPRVRVASVAPAVVFGTHFRAGERVRVRFVSTKTVVVSVRAGATGSFRAAAQASFDPCAGPVLVSAVGASGDRAAAKVPGRECPPANP